MTLEEFVKVLNNRDYFPGITKDLLFVFVEKFYKSNAEIEEWEFYPEGARVIALYKIQEISPDFFKGLLEKRKKALNDGPYHRFPETHKYIQAAILKDIKEIEHASNRCKGRILARL